MCGVRARGLWRHLFFRGLLRRSARPRAGGDQARRLSVARAVAFHSFNPPKGGFHEVRTQFQTSPSPLHLKQIQATPYHVHIWILDTPPSWARTYLMEAHFILSSLPPFCSEKVFALPATDLHNDASGVSISVQCCFASRPKGSLSGIRTSSCAVSRE